MLRRLSMTTMRRGVSTPATTEIGSVTLAPRRMHAAAAAAQTGASAISHPSSGLPQVTQETIESFFRDGIACIPRFIPDAEIDSLRSEIDRLVSAERSERQRSSAEELQKKASVFDPYAHEHTTDEYFMTSGNKVRYFFEKDVDTKNPANFRLENINKIGHALHTENDVFRNFTSQPRLRSLVRYLGVQSPSVVQSMYIVKAPKIGAAVNPHQDSTWIHTSPFSCVGIWFALDDCDVNNACLTAIKGSHFTHATLSARSKLDPGSTLKATLYGELPKVDPKVMEPIECPKGSVVMFNGQCIHASAHNFSDRYRHAYVFHVVDDKCQWSESNWLAPTVARLAL